MSQPYLEYGSRGVKTYKEEMAVRIEFDSREFCCHSDSSTQILPFIRVNYLVCLDGVLNLNEQSTWKPENNLTLTRLVNKLVALQ